MGRDHARRPTTRRALLLAIVALVVFRWLPWSRLDTPRAASPGHAPSAVRPGHAVLGTRGSGSPAASAPAGAGHAATPSALRRLVARVNRTRVMTPEDTAYIQRILSELRRRRSGAV